MRAVFSAMWRSLASATIPLASPRRGARRISRAVSRTGIQASRKVSEGTCSRPVMTGSMGFDASKALKGSRHPVSPSWNLMVPPVRLECRRTTLCVPGLLGRSLRHRNNGYEGAVFGFGTVLDAAIDQGEQRMVDANADVLARMPFRAALAHEDVAGETALSAEQLHAQALAGRVTAVTRGSACFLVCHCLESVIPFYITHFSDEIITAFRHFCFARARGLAEVLVSPFLVSPFLASPFLVSPFLILPFLASPFLASPFVSAAASSSGAFLAWAAGFFGRGGGVCAGFLPSVRISVIRTRVNSCRWPRLRREFLRRRFLKAITLGPRPWSSTSAATVAPATVGVPSVGVSPPTTSTSLNSITSPGLPASFSALTTSSAATRYCLPPVLMTANIVLSSCSIPVLGRSGPASWQSGFAFTPIPAKWIPVRRQGYAHGWPHEAALTHARAKGPAPRAGYGLSGALLSRPNGKQFQRFVAC